MPNRLTAAAVIVGIAAVLAFAGAAIGTVFAVLFGLPLQPAAIVGAVIVTAVGLTMGSRPLSRIESTECH